jgi:nitrate reductase beta subunit
VVEHALDKVATLDAFYYEANELAQSLGYKPIREVGISAQQVKEIMPEVVAPAPIDDRFLTVRYERLVPLLIAAIKELKSEINVLKKDQ